MRHFLCLKKLNRCLSHRKSMLFNLCNSLIKYEFLKTTLVKAKELKKILEPIITISKNFSNFNMRLIFDKLRNIDSIFKLFKILGPRYKYRNGGYLKLYKFGYRKGDNAFMGLIQFL